MDRYNRAFINRNIGPSKRIGVDLDIIQVIERVIIMIIITLITLWLFKKKQWIFYSMRMIIIKVYKNNVKI
jgi:hypothetical protein